MKQNGEKKKEKQVKPTLQQKVTAGDIVGRYIVDIISYGSGLVVFFPIGLTSTQTLQSFQVFSLKVFSLKKL